MMNYTTLQITTQVVGDDTQLVDVLTGVFRPLVPIQYWEAVFQSLHSIHHPGIRASRRLIAARFCWHQMAKAITLMARACLYCQRGKVHKHAHLQPAEIPVPHRRFAHIHIDLFGPLPPSRGHTYLFKIIYQTSRWPEAIPLSSITAADCRALFTGWVSWYGVPATITSDQTGGPSSRPPCVCGPVQPAQHPAFTHDSISSPSNGLVERFHRRLKDAMRSRAAADWHDHLPWVMLGIRASFREDSEVSPAEVVFGSQLILPGQFVNTAESPSSSFLNDLQTTMTGHLPPLTRHNSAPSTLPEELLLGRFVLVRRDCAQLPLSPIYDGPY
jgi:hypothetical protein